MKGIHLEVILACVYAVFLLVTAVTLEWMARHAHRRSKLYRHRGFTFHQHLDAWECPQGEYLRRAETDHALQVVRYRARADGCNACPMKTFCTDSDTGRELVHSTEDWIETEVGRFHRGLSFVLLGLSALIVTVVWTRHHSAPESAVLAVALGGILMTAVFFARALWTKKAAQNAPVFIPLSPWSGGVPSDGSGPAKPFT